METNAKQQLECSGQQAPLSNLAIKVKDRDQLTDMPQIARFGGNIMIYYYFPRYTKSRYTTIFSGQTDFLTRRQKVQKAIDKLVFAENSPLKILKLFVERPKTNKRPELDVKPTQHNISHTLSEIKNKTSAYRTKKLPSWIVNTNSFYTGSLKLEISTENRNSPEQTLNSVNEL